MPKKISLKKNTIANYIGQFYTMFIGIFMLPFYLEYLGAEAYGLVGFFTMLISIMMILDMGLSSTLTREIAKSKANMEELVNFKNLLRSVEIIFIVLSIVLFILILIFADWISSDWLNVKTLSLDEVAYCVVLMGGMLGFKWLGGLYSGCINGLEQQVWLNIYKISFSTFRFIGAFLIIKYISNDIEHFFEYQLFLSFVEFLIITIKLYMVLPTTQNQVKPSFLEIKKIAPFALSIAYVSGIWIVLTQIDKLMLSHFLSLSEYGYFALVVVVANAIMQFSQPIAQAIIPRMTVLFSEGKNTEMLLLYRKSTQFVAIISLSVAGTVGVFGTELLYAWSGNIEAAKFAGPILLWYSIGNALLSLLAFQYYLQYVHGNLKYHVKGNTIFGFIQIFCMFLAIYYYGAIGAGIMWFVLQLFFFAVWTAYIHHIFAPGLHKRWLFEDTLPIIVSTILSLAFFYLLNIDFMSLSRFVLFVVLMLIGSVVLLINIVASSEGRKIILKVLRGKQ